MVPVMQLCFIVLVVTLSFTDGSPKLSGRRLTSFTPFPRTGRSGAYNFHGKISGLQPFIRAGRSQGDLPWNSAASWINHPRVGRGGNLMWDIVPDYPASTMQLVQDSLEASSDSTEEIEMAN